MDELQEYEILMHDHMTKQPCRMWVKARSAGHARWIAGHDKEWWEIIDDVKEIKNAGEIQALVKRPQTATS